MCCNVVRVWVRIRVTEHRFIHALLHLIEELKTLGLLANMSCGTLKKKKYYEEVYF